MPTQRSFFSSFLAAFRAHSAIQKTSTNTSAVAQQTRGNSTVTNPRSIASKAAQAASSSSSNPTTIQTGGALSSSRQSSTSPLSRSPVGSPGTPLGTTANRRRSSSSSNDGFKDILGGEKWYIGGYSAAGEEKYYRLGMVRRHRSIDRLSLDRLSL